MASPYRIEITGNIGHPPSIRYTAEGQEITQFSVAVDERRRVQGSEEWHTITTHWFDVVCYGMDCSQLRKGDKVHIRAYAKTSTYTMRDGNPGTKTRFQADSIELVSRAGERKVHDD